MKYISKAGSRVRTFGKHGRAWEIEWDWLEEGRCFDCVPAFNDDHENPAIDVSCEYCADGGGREIPLMNDE